MGIRREPDRVVFDVKTSQLQIAMAVLAGAVVGVVLFSIVKPFAPDPTRLLSRAGSDSVSWSEAPRFDVEVSGRPTIGSVTAAVTIVEFTDYGCPYCRRHALEVFPALMDSLSTELAYVVRHFPIPALTPSAMDAAVAAECAFRQGFFWEYKSALQGELEGFQEERLLQHAVAIGLDESEFDDCVNDESVRNFVERDILDGWAYGVTGTPTFFINGKRFQGARPLEELIEYVRLALVEAQSNTSGN